MLPCTVDALFDQMDKEAAERPSLAERQKHEIEMWWDWKNSGEDPEKLKPLRDSFYEGLLGQRIKQFQAQVPLPPVVIEAEFDKQFLNALRTYDPNRGRLGSWVHGNLRGAQRYFNKYRNTARIPDHRIYRITEFNTTRDELDDELGRPPTSLELSDRLGWNVDEIERLEAELSHQTRLTSLSAADPISVMPSRERESMNLVRYELSPEETLVYDYLLGTGGKPALTATQIAKKLGWSDSKVSRIRHRIAEKVRNYEL